MRGPNNDIIDITEDVMVSELRSRIKDIAE